MFIFPVSLREKAKGDGGGEEALPLQRGLSAGEDGPSMVRLFNEFQCPGRYV